MDLLASLRKLPEDAAGSATALLMAMSRKSRSGYPFGNPVSIERSHVEAVRSTEYWIAEKSDGIRVALCLTKTPAGECLSFLMDRTGKLYGFPVACVKSYYSNSLFDAELVWDAALGQHVLLVFDVGGVAGDHAVSRQPFSTRMKVLQDCFPSAAAQLAAGSDPAARTDLLKRKAILSMLPKVTLLSKAAARLRDVASAEDLRRADAGRTHASDGFILTPENEGAPPPGTAWKTLKLKTTHTVDLLWDRDDLWYGEYDQLHTIGTLPLTDLPPVSFERSSFASVPRGAVVEISPELRGDGSAIELTFKQTRPDKDTPNNIVTVTKTLKSVGDGVVLDDLFADDEKEEEEDL